MAMLMTLVMIILKDQDKITYRTNCRVNLTRERKIFENLKSKKFTSVRVT